MINDLVKFIKEYLPFIVLNKQISFMVKKLAMEDLSTDTQFLEQIRQYGHR